MSEHELWNELGNLYFLSGEYRQAVHAYQRAIQLDESFGRPYSNLALTYVQQGKYDQAIDLYRRSIELLAEDEEKAISWNRLGDVFRHLKDYKQAVVAFRNADELDPEHAEADDKPGWLSEPVQEARGERPASTDEPLSIDDPFPSAAAEVIEDSATAEEADPTATWAPIDPSLYQQDVFETLDSGSLTTWGEPSAERPDADVEWPPDAEPEEYFPEVDGDDLAKWISIPEEQPMDALEYTLEAVDLAAEMEEPTETRDSAVNTDIFGGLEPEPPDPAPAPAEAATEIEVVGLLPGPIETRTAIEASERSAVTTTDIDIIVEARPTTEFIVAAETTDLPAIDAQAAGIPTAEEAEVAPQADTETQATELPKPTPAEAAVDELASVEPQRDPDEVREIEAGLAKYRRVVQVNPKNARAWDTLGNLYKSAARYKEALLAYQQAIVNDPTKALFHHHLGLVFACEGRIDDAIDAFQRVIEIEPEHALAHAALGGYYRKKGLEELAQKHVGIAMKSIFDSENEYNRACLAAICGNTDQALELLQIALKNKQTYVDWILRDPDLDFIRTDPRSKQLVSDYAR